MARQNVFDPAPIGELDANGDDFQRWIIKRSFAMLAPICKLGLVIMLVQLLLVDPVFYQKGFWLKNQQYFYLAVWHVALSATLLATWIATTQVSDHSARTKVIVAFFLVSMPLFVWFGVISWLLSGDLSMFAVFLFIIAAIFVFPGPLRKVIYLACTAAISVTLYLVDERGSFIEGGHFVNLIAVVATLFAIDSFVFRTNEALFREKCRVEYERARADSVLYNALPASIADELKQHKTVKAEKYSDMTVLFADLVGFTRYSSTVSPNAVVDELNRIFSGFDALVDAHDVEKIKTIGDAYMVVGKSKATAVADLAIALIESIKKHNTANGLNFELRIGINIGPTVAGVIGLKRFLYDVWGDAVNTASRMESLGMPGRIHVSEAYFLALGEAYTFEDRGLIDVKGKGPMHTYFLTGRAAASDS